MKHYQYDDLDDFLAKASSYEDPKTIKLLEAKRYRESDGVTLKAIVHLHTAALTFKTEIQKVKNPTSDADLKLNIETESNIRVILNQFKMAGFSKGHVVETSPQRT